MKDGRNPKNAYNTRIKKAQDFYRKAGWSDARIKGHLAGIDFTKPVSLKFIPKGGIVSQWQVPNAQKEIISLQSEKHLRDLGLGVLVMTGVQEMQSVR